MPTADRESWDERFEVIEPGLRVAISTPYLQYHGSSARTDSGVSVLFRGSSGDTLSSLVASRLSMDANEMVGLGGTVTISPGDSMSIAADSLIWERSGKRLRLPGRVLITASGGDQTGRNLQADLEFRRWSMGKVTSNWRGTNNGEEYLVEVAADSSISERKGGGVIVEYIGATVLFDGDVVRGPSASYDGVDGTLYFHGGVSSADSVEQLAADELHFELGKRLVRASGAVRLAREAWSLEADELRKAGDGEPMQALGDPVVLYHGAKYLETDELVYQPGQRVFRATGAILFRRDGAELRARNLSYDENEQRIEAAGAVVLHTPEVDGELHGQSLLMDLEDETIRLSGAPRLVRVGQDSLTVDADLITIDSQMETLVGEGEFLLASSKISLAADRGEIIGQGEGVQEERLTVTGSVVMTQPDGVVNGDSMVVGLSGGRVAEVAVPGLVEARTQAPSRQTTWIKGRGASLRLEGDRLDRVALEAEAEVLHNDTVNEEVSQISGRQMELIFAAGEGLVRIDVTGEAKFASRLATKKEADKPSLNEVKGEQLTILLDGGEIDQVIIAKPRGSYFPGTKKDR